MFVNLNDITDSTFATFMRPLLGTGNQRRQRPEEHPAMPVFEGRQLPISEQLDAVARRDARMRELNASPKAAEPGIVAKVVEAVAAFADAAVEIAAPLKPRERAAQFLRDILANNAVVPSLEVERLAKEAGISSRTLRRAKKLVGVSHVRNADLSWSWRLAGQSGAAG